MDPEIGKIRTLETGRVQAHVGMIAILELKGEISLEFNGNYDGVKTVNPKPGVSAQTGHQAEMVLRVPHASGRQAGAEVTLVLAVLPSFHDHVVVVGRLDTG